MKRWNQLITWDHLFNDFILFPTNVFHTHKKLVTNQLVITTTVIINWFSGLLFFSHDSFICWLVICTNQENKKMCVRYILELIAQIDLVFSFFAKVNHSIIDCFPAK